MAVDAAIDSRDSLADWQALQQCIIVGTREDLPGCGTTLKGPKDYEIAVTDKLVVVCGYDERGAAFGLYNLEARMNLREAPFLPSDLHTVRHSLYDSRMVQSWMGWMEFPDAVLAHMAHDGFDAIFASVYANPNNDRTTAENSTDFYARLIHLLRHHRVQRTIPFVHIPFQAANKADVGVRIDIDFDVHQITQPAARKNQNPLNQHNGCWLDQNCLFFAPVQRKIINRHFHRLPGQQLLHMLHQQLVFQRIWMIVILLRSLFKR